MLHVSKFTRSFAVIALAASMFWWASDTPRLSALELQSSRGGSPMAGKRLTNCSKLNFGSPCLKSDGVPFPSGDFCRTCDFGDTPLEELGPSGVNFPGNFFEYDKSVSPPNCGAQSLDARCDGTGKCVLISYSLDFCRSEHIVKTQAGGG